MMRKKLTFREAWCKDKIIWITVFTLAVLFIPTTTAHEFGHILICVSNGFDYVMTFDSIFVNVHCSQSPKPIELYWAFGGVFAIISSVWLLVFRKIRTNKGIWIGIVVVAFDQLQKTLFETITHSGYLSNFKLVIFMTILSLFLMTVLLWFFGYHPKKIT